MKRSLLLTSLIVTLAACGTSEKPAEAGTQPQDTTGTASLVVPDSPALSMDTALPGPERAKPAESTPAAKAGAVQVLPAQPRVINHPAPEQDYVDSVKAEKARKKGK